MIHYIAIALATILAIGILWLVQPYKNWKKNFDARQYQPISITDLKHKKYTLPEYTKIAD